MLANEPIRAKLLISQLASVLMREDLEDELLQAFQDAYPETAKLHIEAFAGQRGPAAAILGLLSPGGGTVLSEYAFGDARAVLEDMGRFRRVFPLDREVSD